MNSMSAQSEVSENYRNLYHSDRDRAEWDWADYQHSNSYDQNNYNEHNNNSFNCQYLNLNYQITDYLQAQSAYNAESDFLLNSQTYDVWNYYEFSDASDQNSYYLSDNRELQNSSNVDSNSSDEKDSENCSLKDQTMNYTEVFLVERIS